MSQQILGVSAAPSARRARLSETWAKLAFDQTGNVVSMPRVNISVIPEANVRMDKQT